MTPENIERTIEFLLQHQVNAEVRQEKNQVQIGELIGQNKETSSQIATLTGDIAVLIREMDVRDQRLSAKIEKMSEEIAGLKDVSSDLLNHGHRTDVRLTRLENPDR